MGFGMLREQASGLTRDQRNAFFAAWLGWAMDAFDYFLLVFVISDVAKDFDTTKTKVAVATTLTLAARPVGAALFGYWADKVGRRTALLACVLFYSTVEFSTGFSTSLTMLIALRCLYGVGMGGEWGRLRVEESEVWEATKERERQTKVGFREVLLQPRILRRFVYLVLLMAAFNFMSHGTQDYFPTFLEDDFGAGHTTITLVAIVYNVGALIGGMYFGALSQRFGRRRTIGGAQPAAADLAGRVAFALVCAPGRHRPRAGGRHRAHRAGLRGPQRPLRRRRRRGGRALQHRSLHARADPGRAAAADLDWRSPTATRRRPMRTTSVLHVRTPGGLEIHLDDAAGRVTISGQGSTIRIDSTGITIQAAAKVDIEAAQMKVSAGMVEVDAGMSRFSGVVQCDTLIANSVVAASYTPGAGNVW